MNARDRAAHLVERRLLPLLIVFCAGGWLGQRSGEHLAAEQAEAVALARKEVRAATVSLQQWRQACEPLLSLPLESTPELLLVQDQLPADGAAAGARP